MAATVSARTALPVLPARLSRKVSGVATARRAMGAARRPPAPPAAATKTEKDIEISEAPTSSGMEFSKWELAAASFVTPFVLGVGEAAAQGGEYGIIEGRSIALLHPIAMVSLFASTLYAGYLGLQWRRLREVGTEIKAKKAELPPAGEDGSRPASPLDAEIKALEEERKTLAQGNFRDKHNNWGSLLLGMGVLMSVEGGLNTYLRVGKLFPGPHLFAGASITVLWALAASLVPAMQKGNETARSAHIALNTINVGLFIWQLPTGWDIVLKVFQFTKWP